MNIHKDITFSLCNMDKQKRLESISKGLIRGDVNRVAERAEVSREWASKVLNGRVTSEKVLQAAERLIAERASNKSIN